MRKSLLATTAIAALIGCTTFVMAQTGAPQPRGGQTQMAPGNTAPSPSSNSTIPERLEPGQGVSPAPQNNAGQGQNESTPQRGAQQGEADKSGKSGMNGSQVQTGQDRTKDGGSAKLSQDQRTRIKAILAKDRSAHIDHANFSVTVGAVIPKTVHITVVPEDFVAIVPEYRGFDYIVVGDEILIVNPDTLRIVAIIPA
jgi:hypothetical protein